MTSICKMERSASLNEVIIQGGKLLGWSLVQPEALMLLINYYLAP